MYMLGRAARERMWDFQSENVEGESEEGACMFGLHMWSGGI